MLPAAPATVDATRSAKGVTGRGLRLVLAVAAPLAPIGMGLQVLLSPYGQSDDPAAILDAVAAHPAVLAAQQWIGLVIGLTLVPGVLAAGLAALRRAPRLATAGLLVAVPAWTAGLLFPDTDSLAAAMVATGVPRPQAVALLTEQLSFGTPALGAAVLIFVVGHVVGTVLLGVALYRARSVARWVAVALAAAQPLHFVAFVIAQNSYLDVVAASLTALGFTGAGLALVRRPDRG